jgi:hypothetical protein
VTGTAPIPNTSVGVRIDGDFKTVDEDTIAFKGYAGILVYGGPTPRFNGLHRNSIFSNGYTGIDLVAMDANDPRDADNGPNLGQNYPIILSAVADSTSMTVTGFLTKSNVSGPANIVFAFGPAGGTPVTGDWDGDDTVGLYFPGTAALFLKNIHAPGPADVVLIYGPTGARPVTGDWDG